MRRSVNDDKPKRGTFIEPASRDGVPSGASGVVMAKEVR
jgi:hypothetical protein